MIVDFAKIMQLLEKDIFKGADEKEITKRRAEYDKVLAQEKERADKEREARFRAMGPRMEKVQRLVPVIKELWDAYIDDQADWRGNYDKVDYYDQPTQISFNIKMYGGPKLPDWAQKKLDAHDLEETFWDSYMQYLQDQLDGFAEGLTEDYDFIEKWFQEGQQGGWLVLQVSPISSADDMRTVIDVFTGEAGEAMEEEWTTPRSLQQAYEILRDARKELSTRINAYQEIADKIEKGKKEVEKYAASDEYLNDFFEGRIEDEPAAEEAK